MTETARCGKGEKEKKKKKRGKDTCGLDTLKLSLCFRLKDPAGAS